MKYINLRIAVRLFIVAFALLSCSVDHNIHSDPIMVSPITVNHKISIDLVQLKSFFHDVCVADVTNDTQAKIDACVNKKIDEFLNALSMSGQ